MITVPTHGGHQALLLPRPDTNDGALAYGVLDEYDLPIGLTGWAIDIGAHIGIVTVALALDNPELQIVAVEALSPNVAVLRDSIERNGLTNVHIEHAGASEDSEPVEIVYGWTRADNQPDGYIRDSRYIGGMVGANETSLIETCSPLSLGAILDRYQIERVAFLKIDCEGCEWSFLRSPEIGRVDVILGEYHDGSVDDIRAMLGDTHTVEHLNGTNVGHFRATVR